MEELTLSTGKFMLRRILEGSNAPEEHAEPWLAASPALSKFIRRVSPSIPGNARLLTLDILGPSPFTSKIGICFLSFPSKRFLKRKISALVSGRFF